MTYAEFLLALCIWREARGESIEGMIAVGCVIRNRVLRWKQDWRKVIVGANQFSSITIKGDPNTVLFPAGGDPVFTLAANIYNETTPDSTGGATFYADEGSMTSEWYKTHIVNDPSHPVTIKIGRHTFRK